MDGAFESSEPLHLLRLMGMLVPSLHESLPTLIHTTIAALLLAMYVLYRMA